MKKLTLIFASGTEKSYTLEDTDAQVAVTAHETQQPSHPLRESDTSVSRVNMRHVEVCTVDDAEGEEPTPVQEVSETDTRTKAELQDALKAAGIDYPSDALKADLLELAQTNNV